MTENPSQYFAAEIKHYTKILESKQLFSYSYKKEQTFFYYVVFSRLGKPTGSLILTSNPYATKEERLHAGRAFFHFNRVIGEAADQLVPDIRRPLDLFENTRQLLRKAQWKSAFDLDPLNDAIYHFYDVMDSIFADKEKLKAILLSVQESENRVLNRGYLLDEDVERMLELNVLHYRIMYRQGRMLIGALPHMLSIKRHLEQLEDVLDAEEQALRKTLHACLDAMTVKRSVKVLKKSNASFEKNYDGQLLLKAEGAEGLKHYKEKARNELESIYLQAAKRDIRNL